LDNITLKDVKRFDTARKIKYAPWYLRLVTWIISFPAVWLQPSKIEKENMENLEGGYLLLCNHNSFYDFMVATAAIFPKRANYVVAIDGFIKIEWLLRAVGGICKRKFANDITLVKQLVKVAKDGEIIALYPEARYSLCGTNSVLPDSLGKLIKLLNVPVVTLITKGHHINSPFWNLRKRGIPTQAHMKYILSKEDLKKMTLDEINEIVDKEFAYDDFKWQLDNKVEVKFKKRAEGLHSVLYQCPNCMTEYKMASKEDKIFCKHCNKKWQMTKYGQLEALEGETEFSHVPSWYEWQRKNVRAEVDEGKYSFEREVVIRSLPNSKGFIPLGKGYLIHNMEGFVLTGTSNGLPFEIKWPAKTLYSCHIEYNYLGKYGDCVDLNTLNDTLYTYPQGEDFSVTKISLATEELFKKLNGK